MTTPLCQPVPPPITRSRKSTAPTHRHVLLVLQQALYEYDKVFWYHDVVMF